MEWINFYELTLLIMKYTKLQLEALVLSGDEYLRNAMEREALEAYSTAFVNIPWDCEDDFQALLQQAYKGLCALSVSRDECVWEDAGQLIRDYHQYLNDSK
jgi:hypothetical protein